MTIVYKFYSSHCLSFTRSSLKQYNIFAKKSFRKNWYSEGEPWSHSFAESPNVVSAEPSECRRKGNEREITSRVQLFIFLSDSSLTRFPAFLMAKIRLKLYWNNRKQCTFYNENLIHWSIFVSPDYITTCKSLQSNHDHTNIPQVHFHCTCRNNARDIYNNKKFDVEWYIYISRKRYSR